mmetsp:Transcript_10504/g.18049  ORF Transcript_10504/g.18049 Transcript_10504/m.18049 type:complete len:91 (+) Transcript_10504:424-696(+)
MVRMCLSSQCNMIGKILTHDIKDHSMKWWNVRFFFFEKNRIISWFNIQSEHIWIETAKYKLEGVLMRSHTGDLNCSKRELIQISMFFHVS